MYEINGQTFTQEQIEQAAFAYGLSVSEYLKKLDAQYKAAEGKELGSPTTPTPVEPNVISLDASELRGETTSSESPKEEPKIKKAKRSQVESQNAMDFTQTVQQFLRDPLDGFHELFDIDKETEEQMVEYAKEQRRKAEQEDLGIGEMALNAVANLALRTKGLDNKVTSLFTSILTSYEAGYIFTAPGMPGVPGRIMELNEAQKRNLQKNAEEAEREEAAMLPVGQFTDIGSKKTKTGDWISE